MITILIITLSTIILYLIYPFWLMKNPKEIYCFDIDNIPKSISLIYLSYNGVDYLENKINFLLNELAVIDDYEIIIVDDNSNDGSKEVLRRFKNNHVKVIIKDEQKGIPDSMNRGIKESKFNTVIFSDQRQNIHKGAIIKLITPFNNPKVGAVSGCISHLDKANKIFPIRAYENFVKLQEGKTGNLIGVYGPLYAIRRDCYQEIPHQIILDDLYLTLKILSSHHVIFINECIIIDDDAVSLYNYKRIKRYLIGLHQLAKEKELIGSLNKQQILMLLWHKYLKLCIPLLLLISNMIIGILGYHNLDYLTAFILINVAGLFSLLSSILNFKYKLQTIIAINIFYVIALFELLFLSIYKKKYSWAGNKLYL